MKTCWSLRILILFLISIESFARSNQDGFREMTLGKALIYRLTLVNQEGNEEPSFYGAAILMKRDARFSYFLTNSHLLPNPVRSDALRIQGYETRDQKKKPVWIGSEPGFDIAVLALPNQGMVSQWEHWNREVEKLKPFRKENLNSGDHKLAMLGWKDYSPVPFPLVHHLRWDLEAKFHASVESPQTAHAARQLLERMDTTSLTVSEDCMPHFVTSCYQIGMLGWGFSGGALMVHRPSSKLEYSYEIGGLLTGFEPLTPFSYALPIGLAIERAEKLIDAYEQTGRFVDVRNHPTLPLRWVKQGSIQWDLNGNWVNPLTVSDFSNEHAGGGGEHAGGGGEHAGGGGEHAGGGGEHAVTFSTHELLVRDRNPDQFTLHIKDPQSWIQNPSSPLRKLILNLPSFKGISHWLDRESGIFLPSTSSERVDSPIFFLQTSSGIHPIEHLSEWIHLFEPTAQPLRKLWNPIPIPNEISTQDLGLRSGTKLRYHPETEAWRANRSETHFFGLENVKLTHRDLQITLQWTDSPTGYIKHSQSTLSINGKLQPVSPRSYRYFGPIQFTNKARFDSGIRSLDSETNVTMYGFLTVKRNEDRKAWDIKTLVVSPALDGTIDEDQNRLKLTQALSGRDSELILQTFFASVRY